MNTGYKIKAFYKTFQFMVLVLFALPTVIKAQRQRVHTKMLWGGYFNTLHLNSRYAVGTDVQLRTKEWAGKWSQQLIRTGLSYKFSNNYSATAGIAWFRHAQYNNATLMYRNEWRPWQEISKQVKWSKAIVGQRFRSEQRLIQQVVDNRKTNTYNHSFRLRYRLELQFPLMEKKLLPHLVNEFMVHPGHIGTPFFFDQNRTFAGVNIKVSPATTLQVQYMKLFQLKMYSNNLEDQDIIRINIHQHWQRNKKT